MIDQLILTKRFRSVKPIDGDIRIHVVRDTLSFIRENLLDGNKLNAENCPKEAQDCLFESAINVSNDKTAIIIFSIVISLICELIAWLYS